MVIWTALYTFLLNPNGNRYVLYLYWNDGAWNWNYNWLDNDRNVNNPSAVLATLFISLSIYFEEGFLCFYIGICYNFDNTMTQRFFLNQKLDRDIVFIKDRALVHQMKSVLRLKKGERVIFFNDLPEEKGIDTVLEVKNIDGSTIAFLVRERIENRREPTKKLTLYCALIKKDKFEWVLQKGTEVGVSEFVPVLATHSEKKNINMERSLDILKEAAEQSGRAVIPTLHSVMSFENAMSTAVASGAKTYFADTTEHEIMLRGAGERAMNLFIGPEGGWDEKEVFAAQKVGLDRVSMGRLILRAETAAVVGSYLLLWG